MKSSTLPQEQQAHFHSLEAKKALNILGSIEEGLSSERAEQLLAEFGPNRLPEAPRKSSLARFFLQFHNVLIYVLLGAAIVTAALGHFVDSLVISAVVFVNAVIGFIQEGKAEKAMEAIHGLLAPKANVFRNGIRVSIPGEKLVPGDIVILEAGDKVPADLRLISAHGLQIQEAILTGESVPSDKNTEASSKESVLGDRHGMAFSGTLVTAGQARGVVVATGEATEIGRISGMLSQVENLTTPLVEQMGVFGRWLTGFILVISCLILAYGYLALNQPFADLFLAVVGLSVAAIPEGLPAVLTITLAIGVQAMARRNAIVRRLPAIETLGSVSVICTDKTGTLTRNEMMVASVLTAEQIFELDGIGYEPKGAFSIADKEVEPHDFPLLAELSKAAILCNDASIQQRDDGWHAEGDPMEGALLAFAGKAGAHFERENRQWPRTDTIPFDSKHRFMATLHHNHENQGVAIVKGAPERILEMCQYQSIGPGKSTLLDRDYWIEKADEIASRGQRVLAFAFLQIPAEKTVLEFRDVEQGLTLLAMVGMIDPPRAEAIEAVAECHQAMISVKMITGDHAGTAAAIGQKIGLQHAARVLTGVEIDALSDEELKAAVLKTNVFARTSPEHKLRLVMALQSHGMTVAMTGDGVNDAPALKRADAGIAMGLKGNEAAKEAAELVLADDNFASIAAAVKEGRTVYVNLKKVICWTLPTNGGEAMTVLIALMLGMTLPITPVQILWVNLITAVTLGIALAFEPTENSTMRKAPRPRGESLLNKELVWVIVFVSFIFAAFVYGIFQYALGKNYSIELARTMSVNTLVVLEIFYLFFIRNLHSNSVTWQMMRGTRVMWAVVLTIIIAQLLFTYSPPMQTVFQTEGLTIHDAFLVLCCGVVLFFILESEKQIRLALLRQFRSKESEASA